MARTRTLANLRADVRYRGDIEGLTDRHPDANVNRLINESWQALRELVTDIGSDLYLTVVSGTLSSGAVATVGGQAATYTHAEIDWPSDCIAPYHLTIKYQNRVFSLDPMPLSALVDFQHGDSQTGFPEGFHPYNVGAESGTSVGTGKIMVMPAPEQDFEYVLWYLPAWTDLTNDTHVFNGVAGWEEWVVWDCVVKIAARDNDMLNTYDIAEKERERAWARIAKSAGKRQRAMPMRRRDQRGQRLRRPARKEELYYR